MCSIFQTRSISPYACTLSRELRASPVASPKASPKAFLGAPDVLPDPVARPKSPFRPARLNRLSGAPRPSRRHRGRSGRAGQNEKRRGRHLPATIGHIVASRPFYASRFSPAPPTPAHRRSRRRPIPARFCGTIDSLASLAVLLAVVNPPPRPGTRRQILLSAAHTKCSTLCLVGTSRRCS